MFKAYGSQNRKHPGVLLVRFSIDKLNHLSGSYGFQSGKLIGQVVPAALLEGMTIRDGDTAATLAGREYVCMVSIAADDSTILSEKIAPLLQANREIRENGAYPLTQVVDRTDEPLVVNGVVRNGRIEGAGGWCASGLMNAWEEAVIKQIPPQVQTAEVYTVNNSENENNIRGVEIPDVQSTRKTGYGGNIMSMLFSILLIFGGASGQFVLRGTNSSMALVIAGVVFLALDIFSMVRKMLA
ncbi:MAG: hypothetical protein IJP92_11145 [Lachnospiraceae bacterium]|nr:hypothetical protein [Lachnospiraceae bacterium]